MATWMATWKDKWKDHVWSAVTGVAIAAVSLATAAVVLAVVAGSTAAVVSLVTVCVAATVMDFAIQFARQDNFKLGVCLGSAAVTVGALTLACSAFFPRTPEKAKAPPVRPVVLHQAFKDSADRANSKTKTLDIKSATRPGTSATAFQPGG